MTTIGTTRTRYPGASAVAAAAFLLVAFVVSALDGVVGVVYTQGQTLESLAGFDYFLPALGFAVPFALSQLVPMAVGVFVSFWLVLPIRPEQGVGAVVLRALAALLLGLVISIGVEAVRLTTSDLPVNPYTQGGAVDNRYYILVVGGLAHDAWQLFSSTYAVVISAGLALWGWLHTREGLGGHRHGADGAGDSALSENSSAHVHNSGLPG